MAKFNHDMPAGDILGNGDVKGARYWQAPHTFDGQHNHINPATGEILERAEGEKAPPLKTKESVSEKRARQQAALKPKTTATKAAAVAAQPANAMGDAPINLRDWANGVGPKNILFGEIKKQMDAEGYEQVPVSAVEAKAMIKAKN